MAISSGFSCCYLVLLISLILPVLLAQGYNHGYAQRNFSATEREELNVMLKEFAEFPNKVMWSTVQEISEAHPLFFLHQRKAGGTSLRSTLYNASVLASLSSFIPCFGSVGCFKFGFPTVGANNGHKAVNGGHFPWQEMMDMRHTVLPQKNTGGLSEMSCVTNFRHPVSRLISCIYYRFRTLNKCIMDMTTDELREMFFKVFWHDHTCLNEPFRILSGIEDEEWLNMLDEVPLLSDKKDEGITYRRMGFGAAPVLQNTLRHVTRCAPIVTELPESYTLIERRFPRLKNAFQADYIWTGRKEATKCAPPKNAHLNLLLRYTSLERILYNAVYRKVRHRIIEVFGNTTSKHE